MAGPEDDNVTPQFDQNGANPAPDAPPLPPSGDQDNNVMTPEEARAAGYAPPDEAQQPAAQPQSNVMTPEEARAAGYAPAHEVDPNVMTPEEARAAGYAPPVESSTAGAAVRGAVKGAIVTAGSLPEIGLGAEAGAGLGGAVAGPAGAVVGGLAGGALGALGGGYLVNDALNTVLETLGLRQGTGFFSKAQEEADTEQHPYAQAAGNVAGGGVAFGPGAATGMQRLAGAAIFTGLEGGQELVNKGEFDPGQLAIAAAGGALLTQPRGFADRLMARGANVANKIMGPGRPDIKGTPESEQMKDDAGSSQPVKTSLGVAEEMPPPSVSDENMGDDQNRVVRSERQYPKDNAKPSANAISTTFGDMAPDLSAALAAHARPGMEPVKPEELPLENQTNQQALQQQAMPPAQPVETSDNKQFFQNGKATPPEADLSKVSDEGLVELSKAQREAAANVQQKNGAQQGGEAFKPETPEQAAAPERPAASVTDETAIPTAAKPSAYEAPAPGNSYPHADPNMKDVMIRRQVPAPDLVASTQQNGRHVLIDPRVPKVIDVNGKALDPAYPLAVREVARRGLYEELRKPDANGARMPNDQIPRAALAGGQHAEDLWLKNNGYDADRYREIIDGIKYGREAPQPEPVGGETTPTKSITSETAPKTNPEITATVKTPKFVRRTVEALRAMGTDTHTKLADAIEGLPKDRQMAEASRAAGMLRNRTGVLPEKPPVTPRLDKGGYEIDDLGVTAKTKGEAAMKTKAVEAAEQVFKEHPPVDGETKDQLRARLTKAVTKANTLNGGKDPIRTYKPADPPEAWHWLREAQRLAQGRMTQKQIDTFTANEKLLRGGDESVQAYKDNRKGEGEIAMSRRSGEAAVNAAENQQARQFPGETPHEEAEATTRAEPAKPEDLTPAAKAKEIDINTDMSKGEQSSILADMAKVTDNLVKQPDELTGQPKGDLWKAEEAARVRAQEEKTARLRQARELASKKTLPANKESEGAASGVRKVEITPELRARYGVAPDAEKLAATREAQLTHLEREALDKTAEKAGEPLTEYKEPEEGQPDLSEIPPKDETVLARFAKDEGGSFNFSKADGIWNAKINPRLRWFTDLIGHQTRERGIKADSILAQGKSETTRLENQFAKEMDERRVRWIKGATKDEQIKAQLALEKVDGPITEQSYKEALEAEGVKPTQAAWMAKDGLMFRQVMDQAWAAEKKLGSTADYVKNYVSHIFEDEQGARDYIQHKINSLGATWFQKERSFEMIQDAMKAGFKLKYTNPIDVLNARMKASFKMQEIVNSLKQLQAIGLAKPIANANAMEKVQWHKVNAPDRQQWAIAPEITPLWKNAMESVGLRDADNNIGSFYRGWMNVKNTFIPIKLGISAFHWVHVVLNVNIGANVGREITNAMAMQGSLPAKAATFASALPKALKLSMHDALFSLPFDRFGHLGKEGRLSWDTADADKSPEQQMVSRLLVEGGGIPHRNQQDIIQDRTRLDEAIANNEVLKQWPLRAQQVVKKASAWMFEQQIPNLKVAAYLRDASALLQRRPDLINNHIQRGVALRAIMKSNENRFGEMYYNSLFMNRVVKDAAIGSFLSLGWNLGQVREFGGAMANVVTGKSRGAASPSQKTIYDATNKGAYTMAYVATSMLSAGALSYAMSGVIPTDWKDYFFPRVGGNDPEGQPRRLTTPFNTREPIMLKAHIDSEGPIGGLTTFLWNKMILSPVTEALHNKDYYGRELYDTNAPWYQKTFQLVDSILGDNLTPITASSMQRSREQGGGGLKENALAFAGFGPAPAYVNRTPLQRKLSEMYFQHGVPTSRPYQSRGPMHAAYDYLTGAPPSVADERSTGRAMYNRAAIQHDQAGMAKARGYLVQKGQMNPTTVSTMQPGDADKKMFGRVPIEDKLALVRDMTPQEFHKLVLTNQTVHGKDRAAIMKQWGAQRNVK